ncbi:OmpA family protein [Flaviramulus aquimarinus]|uniref:OmpA family protein n=1 Tax=Flaviramulus aquimarinus TaxID=1170456 RepID=A0ABP9ERG2_9FLAO
MKLKNYIIASTLFLIGLSAYAQVGKQKKADSLFYKFSFTEAAKVYHELINTNFNADYATRQLADSYALLRNPDSAVVYYEKVVQQENTPIEYFYSYAQALRGIKNYKQSRVWLKKFHNAGGKIDHIKFTKDGEFINSIFNAKHRYNLNPIGFNSKFSDFGAYEYNNNIYFTSSRDKGVAVKRLYSWNEEPFLDVYIADKSVVNDLKINHKYKLKGDVNSVYHDGPIAISNDGKTLYFSRTNFIKNNLKKDESGFSNLKIYQASLIDGKWTNIEELPFNDNTYSNGHPALSPDGSKLYFTSDMPGGVGKSDIYYVDINEDGTYGKPKNLGNTINTNKNENFPFINSEGVLFFSSDGHHGLGLLDVFATVQDASKNTIGIINLGFPLNSSKDDFSFFMNKDGVTGYFASNREGGVGSDDIYAFSRVTRLKLVGTVYDAINNNAIPNAFVALFDTEGNEIASFEADENGHYEINIDRDAEYIIHVKQHGFINSSNPINSKNTEKTLSILNADFSLDPILKSEETPKETENVVKASEKETTIDPKSIHLEPVYFGFSSAKIRKDNNAALDHIVNLMLNTYPKMTIKIESHSDSRGAAGFNQILSNKRAYSTYKYLVSKGIDSNRIIEYKGYGEEKLVNDCDGTSSCTKAQHQLNRRTNFIVVKAK